MTPILVLALLAVSTRLMPLSISEWPFNADGLTECSMAQDILACGHLDYPAERLYTDSHTIVTPIYNILLAFVSGLLGATPFDIAQVTVAVLSILSLTCAYAISLAITASRRYSLLTGVFLGLFGTFVFLSGSTWKGALGVAFLSLVIYTLMNRRDPRMFAVEAMLLLTIPLVHHLAAAIAMITVAFVTTWSCLIAIRKGSLCRRHYLDMALLVVIVGAALSYYSSTELDRLFMVGTISGSLFISLSLILGYLIMVVLLVPRRHVSYSFAPLAATSVFVLAIIDYFNPIFPYVAGSPVIVLVLIGATALLIGFAWLGMEDTLMTSSIYRSLPIAMILPILVIFVFALLRDGFGLGSHQVFYRSYDYADLALAVGVSLGVMHFRKLPRVQILVVFVILAALLCTYPFGYYSDDLVGVRHDSQSYEVDALEWSTLHYSCDPVLQSDERLSFIGAAILDVPKMPYLPDRISGDGLLGANAIYLLETEWMTVGVNDYPRGHPILDSDEIRMILDSSNVYYVGGPMSNQAIAFTCVTVGQDAVFGYH